MRQKGNRKMAIAVCLSRLRSYEASEEAAASINAFLILKERDAGFAHGS
jgi:hypothetical protein